MPGQLLRGLDGRPSSDGFRYVRVPRGVVVRYVTGRVFVTHEVALFLPLPFIIRLGVAHPLGPGPPPSRVETPWPCCGAVGIAVCPVGVLPVRTAAHPLRPAGWSERPAGAAFRIPACTRGVGQITFGEIRWRKVKGPQRTYSGGLTLDRSPESLQRLRRPPAIRPDRRHDAGPDRIGQGRPSVDQGLQVLHQSAVRYQRFADRRDKTPAFPRVFRVPAQTEEPIVTTKRDSAAICAQNSRPETPIQTHKRCPAWTEMCVWSACRGEQERWRHDPPVAGTGPYSRIIMPSRIGEMKHEVSQPNDAMDGGTRFVVSAAKSRDGRRELDQQQASGTPRKSLSST